MVILARLNNHKNGEGIAHNQPNFSKNNLNSLNFDVQE